MAACRLQQLGGLPRYSTLELRLGCLNHLQENELSSGCGKEPLKGVARLLAVTWAADEHERGAADEGGACSVCHWELNRRKIEHLGVSLSKI